MKPRSYQECARCVMDTTDMEITFDGNGYCNHCTEFLDFRAKHKYHGRASDDELNSIFDEIRLAGKHKEYDCIIGVGGGLDSSYLAYIAKSAGLRPLAVHMDNGWDSEDAVTNLRNITNALGIDYESYVLDWEEFKDLQLSFLKASIPEAETPTDIAIPAALHHFAAKYNIKYVLSGGNLATEGILPKSWHYNAKDLKYFNHIHNTFGKKRLKHFPTFGYKKEMYLKLIKGIQSIYPLNYLPFSKDVAAKLLTEKFNWKDPGGKHYESRYTRFIQTYYLYEKFKIDYRRVALATQICDGQIDRGAAVEQLKSKPYDVANIEDEKQYVAKKLDISMDEFDRIFNLPAKWYWDYPNDDAKLTFIYNTYRKLFKKDKLSSV